MFRSTTLLFRKCSDNAPTYAALITLGIRESLLIASGCVRPSFSEMIFNPARIPPCTIRRLSEKLLLHLLLLFLEFSFVLYIAKVILPILRANVNKNFMIFLYFISHL